MLPCFVHKTLFLIKNSDELRGSSSTSVATKLLRTLKPIFLTEIKGELIRTSERNKNFQNCMSRA